MSKLFKEKRDLFLSHDSEKRSDARRELARASGFTIGARRMKSLQDDAAPMRRFETIRILEPEIQRLLHQVFRDFSFVPLACASIAKCMLPAFRMVPEWLSNW